jgi:hypothetical protein
MKTTLLASTLAALCAAAAVAAEEAAQLPMTAAPLGNAISYQGKLEKNGVPVNGTCNFNFELWDALSAGSMQGSVGVTGVPVTNGLFTVALDFGPNKFNGQARWLYISVRGPGEVFFTGLLPRQAINAAPYALYALGGASGSSQWTTGADGQDLSYGGGGIAVTGASSPFPAGRGVYIESYDTHGLLFGYNYATSTPLNLALNTPGGNVGVGTSTPGAKLDVLAGGGLGLQVSAQGSFFFPVNAALRAIGNTGATSAMGVYATSTDERAVAGFSTNHWGVSGDCTSAGTYGILGTPTEGVYGLSPTSSKPAGRFVNTASGGLALDVVGKAKVEVLEITGGDLAEPFDVAPHLENAPIEPGMVVSIDASRPGKLRVCDRAFDLQVAGVISGANGLAAGVILQAEGIEHGRDEFPIAMSGRVWCWTDASYGAIQPGDRLTSSATPGHAMKVRHDQDAPGAVIGKAMSNLDSGTGLVLVLVNLQ